MKIARLNSPDKSRKSRTQRPSPVKLNNNGQKTSRYPKPRINVFNKNSDKEIELCYDQELQKFEENLKIMKCFERGNEFEDSYPEVEIEEIDNQ